MNRPGALAAAAALIVTAGITVVTAAATPAASAAPYAGAVTLLKDINPGSGSSDIVQDDSAVVGNLLYFAAGSASNGSDVELWVTDGTSAGTHQAADVNPGPGGSGPREITAMGGKVYFYANTTAEGTELWSFDGTTLVLVSAGLTPGTGNGVYASQSPQTYPSIVASGDRIYFAGYPGAIDAEPWVTDGQPGAGHTTKLIDLDTTIGGSFPSGFVALAGGGVVFAGTVTGDGRELVVSNGTSAGTHVVTINSGAQSSNPTYLTPFGAGAMFQASDYAADGGKNAELFTIASAASTTALKVKEIEPGTDGSGFPRGSGPSGFAPLPDGRLVFQATTADDGNELWVSDGTSAGTTRISSIGSQTVGANINPASEPVSALGAVYVGAGASVAPGGGELYATDGTLAGTRQVSDSIPGSAGPDPADLIAVGSQLAFVGTTDASGSELWAADGTATGTRMVADLQPGLGSGVAVGGGPTTPWLGVLGSTLIMMADDGTTGTELYSVSFQAPAPPPPPPPAPAPALASVASNTTLGAKKSYSLPNAQKKKIALAVAVSAVGQLPSGTVTLTEKGKVVGTGQVVNGNGVVRITKKLKLGKHKVLASYAGRVSPTPTTVATVLASSSPVVKFVVAKKPRK